MNVAVYLAAPLSQARRMREWADRLELAGLDITSKWHDTGDKADPHAIEVRRRILYANLYDMWRAHVVLVDTTDGVPGATLSEVGYALAFGKQVVWLQPPSRRADGVRYTNIFDAHVRVQVVTSEPEVLPAIDIAGTMPRVLFDDAFHARSVQ